MIGVGGIPEPTTAPEVLSYGALILTVGFGVWKIVQKLAESMSGRFLRKLDVDQAESEERKERERNNIAKLERLAEEERLANKNEIHELRSENSELRDTLTEVKVEMAEMRGELAALRRILGDNVKVRPNEDATTSSIEVAVSHETPNEGDMT